MDNVPMFSHGSNKKAMFNCFIIAIIETILKITPLSFQGNRKALPFHHFFQKVPANTVLCFFKINLI